MYGLILVAMVCTWEIVDILTLHIVVDNTFGIVYNLIDEIA